MIYTKILDPLLKEINKEIIFSAKIQTSPH